jgi:Meiotically Up-regulated Gene 113 (MUG113) protein
MSSYRHVQQWSKNGKRYLRFRRHGYPSVMRPGPIGSRQFMQAYAAALAQPAATPQPRARPAAAIPKENVPGHWVYIITYGDRGLVKIGTTTRPKQRLAALQATSPTSLKVLAHFPGGRALERRLHVLFAEQRAWNEFFCSTPFSWVSNTGSCPTPSPMSRS